MRDHVKVFVYIYELRSTYLSLWYLTAHITPSSFVPRILCPAGSATKSASIAVSKLYTDVKIWIDSSCDHLVQSPVESVYTVNNLGQAEGLISSFLADVTLELTHIWWKTRLYKNSKFAVLLHLPTIKNSRLWHLRQMTRTLNTLPVVRQSCGWFAPNISSLMMSSWTLQNRKLFSVLWFYQMEAPVFLPTRKSWITYQWIFYSTYVMPWMFHLAAVLHVATPSSSYPARVSETMKAVCHVLDMCKLRWSIIRLLSEPRTLVIQLARISSILPRNRPRVSLG